MKCLPFLLLLLSLTTFAQDAVPDGTVLPTQLYSALSSRKVKAGQTIKARVMQDVPVGQGRTIPAGAKVIGSVVNATPPDSPGPSQITFRFDRLTYRHHSLAVTTSLRALASMLEVEYAQLPVGGAPDRGTPWSWMTRRLIGGGLVYGEGGPVTRGATRIVGQAFANGILAPVSANPAAGCRDVERNSAPQALWVFSPDACGPYGYDGLLVTHTGRTDPQGDITVTARRGNVNVRGGSGLLLRVNLSSR
jgi:hypothetical protein